MSLIEDIAQLMLREGEIKGQSAREQIAAEEERRQAKHRVLKNTLKGIAMFGPLFLPGAPLAGVLGSRWAGMAATPFEKMLMAGMAGAGENASSRLGASPGRVPAGLGYSKFAGPMTHDDWYVAPWDEEGIG